MDVLDAQSDLFAAELNYASARYDYILDTLNLKQAAGTLTVEDLAAINNWLKKTINPKRRFRIKLTRAVLFN